LDWDDWDEETRRWLKVLVAVMTACFVTGLMFSLWMIG